MSEIANQTLSDVSETSLITLYLRAMESQRPDALIKDEKAVELVARMSYDFDRIRQIPLSEANKIVIILRNREFDRYARDFLTRHPQAVVVHIGCGLDSRLERVDNDQVKWYDLDLPDVIELRRKFIGDEGERYHLLGCSVFDNIWLDTVSAHHQRPFLFLAEGVFMYFEGAQVKSLVLTLRDHFPGAELVFDAFSPLHVRWSKLQLSLTKVGAPFSAGGSGAARRSKAGATASACSTSGDSSTSLNRAWPTFGGCATSRRRPGRIASTTFALERQQGKRYTMPPNLRLHLTRLSCSVAKVAEPATEVPHGCSSLEPPRR
jgi:O-methyltransferase involved in polyketide biosynthesis